MRRFLEPKTYVWLDYNFTLKQLHIGLIIHIIQYLKYKLEDLKVLRRSPDLINNVKIGQGFTAYNKTYFVIPYMGVAAILVM